MTTNIRITEGDLDSVKYAIKGLLLEAQSDSIDMGYINEKLDSIRNILNLVATAQYNKKEGLI